MTTPPPLRRWQAEAYPLIMAAIADNSGGLVQAVMGAGKSYLLALSCGATPLAFDECVVVTTPSRKLVNDLAATLRKTVNGSVGRYFSGAKQASCDFIVCCNPSTATLAAHLERLGRKVRLLVLDEAHRSECRTMLAAVNEALRPQVCIGFTATPYRSLASEELSLFSRVLYQYDARQALKDGVVVPYSVIPWTGDTVSVDDACLTMIGHMKGPGVVSAADISDAEAYSAILCAAGVRAYPIHSKQTHAVQTRALGDLQSGHLDCLVHVSMLQEGVDLPWLRWICLRRQSSSKIRFPQEVGRVLRSHPGKDIAYVLDPHDLFGSFRLDYDAVLQGQAEEDSESRQVTIGITGCRDGWWITDDIWPEMWGFREGARVVAMWGKNETRCTIGETCREGLKPTRESAHFVRSVPTELVLLRGAASRRADLVEAVSKLADVDAEGMEHIEAYLRRLVMEFDAQGLVRRQVSSKTWRKEPITEKQMAAVRLTFGPLRDVVGTIPDDDRTALRRVCATTAQLRRGPASDLIGVLWGLTKAGRWPVVST